jgi:Family of unknown function (DUF5681)
MTKTIGLKNKLREADEEKRQEILDGLPYDVGFGKPPRETQFKPGNQAGRRGRPKGSKNLATIVAEQAAAPILVQQGDKQRYLPKQEVAVWQMMNKAAAGDLKATTVFLDLIRKLGPLQPSAQEAPVLDQRDLQVMERLAEFFSSTVPTGSKKTAQS